MTYLVRRKTIDYLPNDEASLVAFRIKAIDKFTLSDMMYINADTLASLQIIQSENHPNSHMQGPNKSTSGAKESLSVYGLFHFLASTPQGRQKLRQIFLRPSTNSTTIEERLNTITVLLRPENQALLENIVSDLKKVKDIRAIVIHLQKGITVPGAGALINNGVWASLRNFTFHALRIIEGLNELNEAKDLAIAKKVSLKNPRRTFNNFCLVPGRR